MPRLPKPRKLSLILIFIIPLILIGFLFNNFASASSIIKSIEFIGQATLPTGLIFQKTEIGGLSGITYIMQYQMTEGKKQHLVFILSQLTSAKVN